MALSFKWYDLQDQVRRRVFPGTYLALDSPATQEGMSGRKHLGSWEGLADSRNQGDENAYVIG